MLWKFVRDVYLSGTKEEASYNKFIFLFLMLRVPLDFKNIRDISVSSCAD